MPTYHVDVDVDVERLAVESKSLVNIDWIILTDHKGQHVDWLIF